MQRRTGKILWSAPSLMNVIGLKARRVAWLGMLLGAASLAERSWASLAGGGPGSGGGEQQVFRLAGPALAQSRAG